MTIDSARPRLSGRAQLSTTRPDWRDGKRYLWLIGAVVPAFIFLGWGLVNLTGLGVFTVAALSFWPSSSLLSFPGFVVSNILIGVRNCFGSGA